MAVLLFGVYQSEGDPLREFDQVSDCDWDLRRAFNQASNCDWNPPRVFDQVSICDSVSFFFGTNPRTFGVELHRMTRHCQYSVVGRPEASR